MKTSKLSIVNFDMYCVGGGGQQQEKKKHGPLLPNNIRCIICGPSNSGKTNVMLNLLFDRNGLRFQNVYVFSKSLYQPKYQLLERVLTSASPDMGYFPFSEHNDVAHPNEVAPNSVMIFDDVSCEKQENIQNYFTMGRHRDIDTFYLCQTYSRVPKQLVRDNANMIIMFKQDDRNLRHVYNDHVNTDMSYQQFKQLCSTAWVGGKNNFLVIDKESELDTGRYRLMFDKILTPSALDGYY